ncbi:carboxypeptidase regulatory-like domain-containing protein [Corallococcus macrosporus]|uniref:Carboxypeptidase regulatory-like domain-containing protein n=1 Tax=Corallococcus macrosporus TaxID=35 RepID=A0ABS3DHI7_9BACT|nr:carboxypeptidase regulatory-like domain-containing protein [Corallococcus macrosporus]MBN8230806.1 carboxypeptidase regulatory-like domain-containing protein [Corallococcus macrosporus]
MRDAALLVEAVEAPDAGLWLTATLEDSRPFEGEAHVGAAFVSDADRAWWENDREFSLRAEPSRLEDLANVREWKKAPVTATAQGGVVGPVEVPSAPRYEVMAFAPDGTVWWADQVPPSQPVTGVVDLGVVKARRPTGIRVRLEGARGIPGTFSVRMHRGLHGLSTEEIIRISYLLPALTLAAPELIHALQHDVFLPLLTDGETRFAPLPPDPVVWLVLRTPAGRRSRDVEVPLREGSVELVTLDVAKLFPEGVGGAVTLRGRVSLGELGRPLGPATVKPDDGEPVPVGEDGRFTVEGVPAWRPSVFTVSREVSEPGRPVAPREWPFTFTPTAGMQGAVEVDWRVPPYRWLVLRMDGFTRSQLMERSREPYPVYLLERRDAQGVWRDVPTQEFLPEEAGVAVSLTEPGTYRVQVASSPYASRPSSAARAGEEAHDVEVRLSPETAPPPSCEVHVSRDGQPVAGVSVDAGGSRSMPLAHGKTDSAGRWRMGAVNSDVLSITVTAGELILWDGDGAEACRRSGVVEVRL